MKLPAGVLMGLSGAAGCIAYRLGVNLTSGASWHERLGEAVAIGATFAVVAALCFAARSNSGVVGRGWRVVIAIPAALLVGGAVRVAINLASSSMSWDAGIEAVVPVAIGGGIGAGLVALLMPTRARRERTA